LAKGPTNRHNETIRRNFYDAKKFEQYSKVTFILSGSNNLEIWGQSPQPPKANRGLGAEPTTLRRYFQLFPKNEAFLGIFWSKFLLKNMLLNYCNECLCATKVCAQDYMPPLFPLATPLIAKSCAIFQVSLCLFCLTSIFYNCVNLNIYAYFIR